MIALQWVSCEEKAMNEDNYSLCLYIAGQSIASDQAYKNIQHINHTILNNRCEITVVDLSESPSLARKHRIIAIPTLERLLPVPVYRVVGDLSMTDKVLSGLGIPYNIESS